MSSFVIQQYIGHNSIKELDEKLKGIIVLLQDKVVMPRDEGRALNSSVNFLEGYSEGG